ncbi:MAG: LamB/YcsF family protein [Gammaproteobacteria bacterium]|nr:LamB/YcsF family protein [Gammaproteobacteria bacterium]
MDLNADLGEGGDHDAALLGIVTSASIACGGHAGDQQSMTDTVAMAVHNGVSIGAHVSYPDPKHFGRRDLDLPADILCSEILSQLHALDRVARSAGASLHYVKAHGALYNRMADDAATAEAVLTAIQQFGTALPILILPDCIGMDVARARGIAAVAEAFVDRAYTDAGRLVPRAQPGAVITDAAAERAVSIACQGRVRSINNRVIELAARSLCVHSDTPGAVTLARTVRDTLLQAGITLRAFA